LGNLNFETQHFKFLWKLDFKHKSKKLHIILCPFKIHLILQYVLNGIGHTSVYNKNTIESKKFIHDFS
jgi:hypothetical protein